MTVKLNIISFFTIHLTDLNYLNQNMDKLGLAKDNTRVK